jgi:hypothetical protein
MFIDPKFGCATIHEVIKEIITTTKFKKKYPWRTEYRGKLHSLPATQYRTPVFENVKKAMTLLLGNGVINEKTQRMIDLSEEDQAIAACAIANDYFLSTGDANLIAFLQQEFKQDFKGNLSALEVINFWTEKNIITWDDAKQAVIAEWKLQDEIKQPKESIIKFTKLTRRTYPGN